MDLLREELRKRIEQYDLKCPALFELAARIEPCEDIVAGVMVLADAEEETLNEALLRSAQKRPRILFDLWKGLGEVRIFTEIFSPSAKGSVVSAFEEILRVRPSGSWGAAFWRLPENEVREVLNRMAIDRYLKKALVALTEHQPILFVRCEYTLDESDPNTNGFKTWPGWREPH